MTGVLVVLDESGKAIGQGLALARQLGQTAVGLFVYERGWNVYIGHDWLLGSNARATFLGYIEDGATTIGIGSKPMISPRGMVEIKELVHAHNVRIHRFGNFDFKFIARWQIESADSGRYFRSAQFGKEVWFWDSQENRPVRWDLRSSAPLPEEYRHTLDHVFGWTVNDLLGGDVSNIWLVNIFSHQQMQHYLTATLGI